MRPPESFESCVVAGEEGGEVGDHQQEDERGDDAGFIGNLLAEPDGANEEAADEEACDGDGNQESPGGGEEEVEAVWLQESYAQAGCEVVEGDESEGEESPEDEGVGDAGKRALADDFGLEEDFAGERPDTFGDGAEREAEVFAGFEDGAENRTETIEEERCGGADEEQQEEDFEGGEVLGFGERHTGMIPLAGKRQLRRF